ncbi:dipeptidase PepE [Flavobacteriaceae bacterium]|jgi:dipeptidase E|nr:dipeptidase PepE [Flavobacteriaceae bacterium]MDC3285148.1 dipeptidase PepE [Flavobacteriaceae bacterium]MDC3318318.1 dipeptidase PepE [Flavobacteriaceae bacterium]
MKKLLVASSSTIHGSGFLEYLSPTLTSFFEGVSSLVFIPYARPSGISYDEYTLKVAHYFNTIGIDVTGIHEFESPIEAIEKAEAIFTGGGNTFELVNQLYKQNLFSILSEVLNTGTPYLGTSAGSNICGISMMNTNDMPIVYPPSFLTLGIIPFNINAHYIEPVKGSKHMGETRETRIKEYHFFNQTPVLGLREGSWLEVVDESITLKGSLPGKWFEKDKKPMEIPINSILK